MGELHHSRASLRFFGDDLVPDDLSALIGARPSESCVKGQQLVSPTTGQVRIAKTGSWRLNAERRKPADLDAQVFELLGQLTDKLEVWATLSRYKPDLFCGLFMAGFNDRLPLSAKALLALGQRGIALDLDIYESDDEH